MALSRDRLAELELLLQQKAAELADARKALESLTYSVSHDLRAPLRHISGYAQIMREDYGQALAPECRDYLEKIQDSARRMSEMLADLLKLSRLTQQELRPQTVDLNVLVQDVIQDLAAETEPREVEWRTATLPQVECNREMVKLVFSNLLSNALKFTRTRPRACIEIGNRQDGERVFFVRDNGAGFDMRYADKLFGLFQRLHPPGDFAGLGAGLALAQCAVHKHGGRIWAEAEPEKGATFYFTLERRSGETPSS